MTAIHSSDRAAWLEARMQVIGASEVAAVLGENEYTTRAQVILEKAGLGDPFTGNERTEISLALEPFVAELARMRFGWQLQAHGELTPDSVCPRLAATPDFVMSTPWGMADVQVKVTTVKPYEGVKKYGGAPPLMYQLQVQAELACLGYQHGVLLVLHLLPLCLRAYYVPRHDLAISRIRSEVTRVWLEVEAVKSGRIAV